MPPIDPETFRYLCGFFPTGVAVVTTRGPDGGPVGMTANSFTSVSLDPPLVSVSIDRAAEMHRHILDAERFAINILAGGQESLSRRFAAVMDDRFAEVVYSWNDAGLPILSGTLASVLCERVAAHAAGDHTIVLGRVTGGGAGQGRPLLFYRGLYYDGSLE